MKRISFFLILLCLPALACFAPVVGAITPTAPAAPITAAPVMYEPSPTGTAAPACVVTADSLNVRSQPEGQAESNVLTWLYSGNTVTVLETRGAWLYIRAGNVTGWIKSNYCKGK